ncbi:hypothetical protein [Nocardia testacea]|uniref:hypothetical protein n=1 Tax=Nocardia testacea TaxID=248551 RepID=UPI0033CEF5E8
MAARPAVTTYGEESAGCVLVGVGASIVFGAVVVVDRVDVVVGDAGAVDTSGDVDVAVEVAGIGVVVVPVGTVVVVVVVLIGTVVVPVGAVVVLIGTVVVPIGAVVVVVGAVVAAGVDVTVIVDGSAGTVTVPGSVVTVTVGVSAGVVVAVAVDVEVEVTVPGSCTLNVASNETLAVAEKLAVIDASGEFAAGASGVVTVVDSVVAAPVPGSVESAVGSAVPVSVAVSAVATSPGTETSPDVPGVALVFVMLVRLRAALWSKARTVGSAELFGHTAGPESVRATSVTPIAVVTSAAATPARDICRRNRSADGAAACRPHHRGIRGRGGSAALSGSVTGSSLLSSVRIQLLLSPSRRADRWGPVTSLRSAEPVKSVTTPPSARESKLEGRTTNSSSSAERRRVSSTVPPRRTARARHT